MLRLPLRHLRPRLRSDPPGIPASPVLQQELTIRAAFRSGRKVTMWPSSVVYAFIPSKQVCAYCRTPAHSVNGNSSISSQSALIPCTIFVSWIQNAYLSGCNRIQYWTSQYSFLYRHSVSFTIMLSLRPVLPCVKRKKEIREGK